MIEFDPDCAPEVSAETSVAAIDATTLRPWLSRKLRLSIAPKIINKNQFRADYADGFVNQQMTINQLADEVRQGKAFSCELMGSRRKDTSFVASDTLSVDLDQGSSVEALKSHPFFQKYGSLMYTTASHTEEDPRLRAVFVTEKTIDNRQDMRAASTR